MHNVTEIQQRLISLGYLAPVDPITRRPNDDGKFGERSLDAYNHFRASKGKGPVVQASMAELNADLFPEEQPAPAPKRQSTFDLGTLLSLINLVKGKTMTADQITGVLRAILALVSGYFISKGLGSADLWNWIIAGVTGVIPFIWTWISNRPKTIVPLSQKLSQ